MITLKKRRSIVLILLVLVSALWLGKADAEAEQEVVKLAIDDWCPYVCNPATENGKVGYISEVVLTILRKHGFETKTAVMPYSRIINEVRLGRWHISPAMSKANAPDFLFSAEPIVYNSFHFYVKKGTPWRFEGPDSFDSIGTLGLIQDYSYEILGERMAQFLKNHPDKTDWLTGNMPLTRNIKKLLAGRVDALIADRWTMAYQLNELGVAEQVVDAGQIGSSQTVYIGYSPTHLRSAEYARLIDEGIRRLKATGAMLPILEKYGLTEELYKVSGQ